MALFNSDLIGGLQAGFIMTPIRHQEINNQITISWLEQYLSDEKTSYQEALR